MALERLGILFFECSIEKSMDYSPKSFGSHRFWCKPKFPLHIPPGLLFKVVPENLLANVVHACHVRFHGDVLASEKCYRL